MVYIAKFSHISNMQVSTVWSNTRAEYTDPLVSLQGMRPGRVIFLEPISLPQPWRSFEIWLVHHCGAAGTFRGPSWCSSWRTNKLQNIRLMVSRSCQSLSPDVGVSPEARPMGISSAAGTEWGRRRLAFHWFNLWNALPNAVKATQSINVFKSAVKINFKWLQFLHTLDKYVCRACIYLTAF